VFCYDYSLFAEVLSSPASFQSQSQVEYNDSKQQDKRGETEAKNKEKFNQ
jgi:hypothetical protein